MIGNNISKSRLGDLDLALVLKYLDKMIDTIQKKRLIIWVDLKKKISKKNLIKRNRMISIKRGGAPVLFWSYLKLNFVILIYLAEIKKKKKKTRYSIKNEIKVLDKL